MISTSLIFSILLTGQDISTVEEIYDFEVDDIFHYDFSAEYGGGSGMISITNIEILDKYYSPNNDTLFYIRDIDYQEISAENPVWTFEYYIDTVYYIYLDSLINSGNIDSVYTNINLYNGRIINYMEDITYDHTWKLKFVKGCGLALEYFYDENYFSEGSNELVYYNKGGEEWGTPIIVSTNGKSNKYLKITVFPNPANNRLNFNFQNPNCSYEVELRNLYGQLVKQEKNIQSPYFEMNVADLKAGVYFYRIGEKDRIVQQERVVIR